MAISAIRTAQNPSNLYSSSEAGEATFSFQVLNCIGKIKELSALKEGWNGYSALAPTDEAIVGATAFAVRMLQSETPTPDIFPTPSGNIQFEWSCHGIDLEVEVKSEKNYLVAYEDLNSDITWERSFTFDLSEISDVIKEITNRSKIQNANKRRLRVVS